MGDPYCSYPSYVWVLCEWVSVLSVHQSKCTQCPLKTLLERPRERPAGDRCFVQSEVLKTFLLPHLNYFTVCELTPHKNHREEEMPCVKSEHSLSKDRQPGQDLTTGGFLTEPSFEILACDLMLGRLEICDEAQRTDLTFCPPLPKQACHTHTGSLDLDRNCYLPLWHPQLCLSM